MKYKLINKTTGEEHICSKETVNDFDYYIGDVVTDIEHPHVWDKTETKFHPYLKFIGNTKFAIEGFEKGNFLKIVATNRPDVKIPKVIDENVLESLIDTKRYNCKNQRENAGYKEGIQDGYNHSQETHPHSDDDVIEFADWLNKNASRNNAGTWVWFGNMFYTKTSKELLQLWKEQKLKTIYYE